MSSRFAVIPTRALYDTRLTPDLIYVLAGLASFADKDNTAKVRQSKLGETLGLSRETINRRIATLMELGYVSQIYTPARVSSYLILVDTSLPDEFWRVTEAATATPSPDHTSVTQAITPGVTQAITSIPPFSSTVLIHRAAGSHPPEHPAVLAYRDVARLWPDRALRPDIAKTVTDLDLWKKIIKDWIGAGYKKTNIAGMLECYAKGRVDRPGGKQRQSGMSDTREGRKAEYAEAAAQIAKAKGEMP